MTTTPMEVNMVATDTDGENCEESAACEEVIGYSTY